MKTRKTNIKERNIYTYERLLSNNNGGYEKEVIVIKPGENGVTVADIKMLHSMDDSEVYYNNKNLRPGRTAEEKAEIKAWKEKYVKRFEERHGYKPNKDDVDYAANKHFLPNYNSSIDFDADGELEVDKSHLAEALSTTDDYGFITNDYGFEMSEEMEHAFSTLTDKQRQVIRLMFIEGYTQSEIASMLGISSAGVKKHLDSAIVNLKKVLPEKF
ncbi:sigma-70 family RNA polymerase sigma factor [Gardnerella vaginalis]|uniref:sigma-70 family RNA polymerase sigma factor n=1 Tax=Gardnerella vaginalis TaxID=2702 RepID=UPI0009424161|nr:sigma-70 family RNA polymerase sigma factor [Gardnerella vaginalis]AYZ22173.1 sigma-70 family RNA polymerase sigma factor [Gardnerella vaginalis]OKY54906.1 RNA polymerase sigma factor [Gardnerella vaginalis]PNL26300.1 RNA polymerase subunit sigma-24 [Gardnerella vaginalis]PTE03315.1 RNA polymerase subunit sigma-24 [Gardnerella vaginalis]